MSARRRLRLRLCVVGALALAACTSPTAGSEGPPVEPAPSSTELFDIAEGDPLPFPGYGMERVTIAPLPQLGAPGADGQPLLTGWAAFDATLQQLVLPGGSDAVSVAVAIDGDIVHASAMGARIPDTLVPAEPTDKFRIASISKPITAVVALRLVEEGVVGLDEPVGSIVASAVGVAAPSAGSVNITLRQLLTHTSGFAQYENLFFRTQVGSCEEAAAVGFSRSVYGPSFRYSNMNYCVLGLLIEQLTGQPYEAAVHEYLLTPLGITGMRLAPTHEPDPGEAVHRSVPGRNYMEVLAAAGAWVASPSDLVTIFDSLDLSTPGWKPLGADMLAQMRTTVTNPGSPDRGYAMGVILYGGGAAGHTGTIESTHSMVLDRADNVTWAVTVSGQNPSETVRLVGMVDQALTAGGFIPG